MKKRLLAILLVFAMMFSLAIPAMATADNNRGSDNVKKMDSKSVASHAIKIEGFGFHCNDIEGGGNGRAYVADFQDVKAKSAM